jgi:hypothetical protein
MDEALRSVADYGLAIVGVVAFAVALWWVLREYINSLKATRDEALEGWRDQTAATDKLADKLVEVEQRLVDLLRDRRKD